MSGGDTLGLVQVDVSDVAVGATSNWEITVPLTATDLTCVLRVERFAPQQ